MGNSFIITHKITFVTCFVNMGNQFIITHILI